jgi:hypothetical protein
MDVTRVESLARMTAGLMEERSAATMVEQKVVSLVEPMVSRAAGKRVVWRAEKLAWLMDE